MYTLVTIPGSCSTGIHVLLNTLNIKAEVVKRDDLPNYQQLVPTNQVPALIEGEEVLTEGAAIVLHLLEQNNLDLSAFGEPKAFLQWLMFNYSTLHPAYGQIFTAGRLMEESDEKDKYLHTLANKVTDTWKIVDARLAQQPYLAGDKVSVLDYLLAVYANWGNFFPQLTIKLGDNVKRVINEVSKHEAFVRAFEQEQTAFSIPNNA